MDHSEDSAFNMSEELGAAPVHKGTVGQWLLV